MIKGNSLWKKNTNPWGGLGSHNKKVPYQPEAGVRIWHHKPWRQLPLWKQIKFQQLTDHITQQLTCYLACVHLDTCSLLLSQRSPHPGLFLFLHLNKMCFVLTATWSWNLSGSGEEPGGCLTLERSWIPKPDIRVTNNETYQLIFFINIDGKILKVN